MECSSDLGWYGDTLPHRSKRLMILLVNSKIKYCPGNTSERRRSFMGSSCKGGKVQSALIQSRITTKCRYSCHKTRIRSGAQEATCITRCSISRGVLVAFDCVTP